MVESLVENKSSPSEYGRLFEHVQLSSYLMSVLCVDLQCLFVI